MGIVESEKSLIISSTIVSVNDEGVIIGAANNISAAAAAALNNTTAGNSRRISQELAANNYLFWCLVVVVVFYILGAFGNFLALVILAKKKNSKNSKYTLMLRCLATNNLIGLMGMLTQLSLKAFLPIVVIESYVRYFCIGRVVWRFFGLSSGCIAAVMAAERWMALAKPFIYHKHITYNVVKKTITYLIYVAAILTFLPITGFGVYFDSENNKCLRYRDGKTAADIGYAYLFMIFGTLLCAIIVACNLFVTRVLCIVGNINKAARRQSIHYDMVNRGEKGSCGLNRHGSFPSASSDEIRFAKLMTFLSISFVICWMPQMISVPLTMMPNALPSRHWFFRLADILMALHFTSDPYIYVLSRTKHSYILDCIKRLTSRGRMQRTHSDQSRLRPTMEQTVDYGLNAL